MKQEPLYRIPDVIDIICDDIINGFYFNTLHSSGKNRVKLKKCNIACDLLLNTNLSDKYISDNIGFPDTDTFRITFKSYLGIEPNEFRKRFGKKK